MFSGLTGPLLRLGSAGHCEQKNQIYNKISFSDLLIDSSLQPCIGRYPSFQLDPLLCELIDH